MKIKTTNTKQPSKIKFPCLMVNKNNPNVVIYATELSTDYTGLLIRNAQGDVCSNWMENYWDSELFIPFEGTLILEND